MIENKILGEKFAHDFNKKYGIITYSGTLAIEVALSNLNLKENAKVLIISEVCYSIANTILKLGFVPVIVVPQNELYLTNEDIDSVLNNEHIDCILLVHQYGILNNVDLKKYKLQGIKIIEDVAQAWSIKGDKYTVGKYSDIVVTSFGKTKPISYGIGGGLFFNDKKIFETVDYYDNNSRDSKGLLLSYTYPLCSEIKYMDLKKTADRVVNEQRNNSKKYYNLLKNNTVIKCMKYEKGNVWHRFPIWVEDYKQYIKLINILKDTDLEYQLLHKINLIDLRRNENCIKHNNRAIQRYIILLRTRNVDINKQIIILNGIINNMVS